MDIEGLLNPSTPNRMVKMKSGYHRRAPRNRPKKIITACNNANTYVVSHFPDYDAIPTLSIISSGSRLESCYVATAKKQEDGLKKAKN